MQYSGGAHGNPFRDYFVFDRYEQLTLSDIVGNPVEELQRLSARHSVNWLKNKLLHSKRLRIWKHTVADDVSYDSNST